MGQNIQRVAIAGVVNLSRIVEVFVGRLVATVVILDFRLGERSLFERIHSSTALGAQLVVIGVRVQTRP